jgi:hypothetical protein
LLAVLLVVAALASPAFSADSIDPSLRSVSTSARAGAGSSLTVKAPTGAVDGDVLLAVIDARWTGQARISAPRGWRLVRRDSIRRGGELTQAIYVKVASSGDPGAFTWHFPTRVAAAAAILAYADVDPEHPVDVAVGRTASGSSIRVPSVTTAIDGSLLVGVFAATGRTTIHPAERLTRRYQVQRTRLSGVAADIVQQIAGPTGVIRAWIDRALGPMIAQLVALRPAPLEAGDLRLFDEVTSSPTRGSWVQTVTDQVYDGARAARAHTAGSGSVARYARAVLHLDLGAGTEVWYSGAFFLPRGFYDAQGGQVDLMRWDNWTIDQRSTDRGGLVIFGSDHGARLVAGRLGRSGEQRVLTGPFAISEGAWHWLEVHQRFSAGNTDDLSEVYLDGQLMGASTAKNWYGRPITRLRFGIVATDDDTQSRPLDLWFDAARLSPFRIGPATSLASPG